MESWNQEELDWLMEIDLDDLMDTTPADHLWAQACMEIEIQDLKTKLKLQEKQIEAQAKLIRTLDQRLANTETAILWCGESCFDEMATVEPNKYCKL